MTKDELIPQIKELIESMRECNGFTVGRIVINNIEIEALNFYQPDIKLIIKNNNNSNTIHVSSITLSFNKGLLYCEDIVEHALLKHIAILDTKYYELV